MIKKFTKKFISVLFWIVLWQLLSMLVSNSLLVPAPLAVACRLGELSVTPSFWQTVALSLLRITAGIALSVIVGVVLAVLSFCFSFVETLLSPLMNVVKATPVASFIMLALLWLSRDFLPVFISVLIVVPVVTSNVLAGLRATDPMLLQVSKAYRFSLAKTLRHNYLPSVYPHFISACRSSLGLAWKAGIAAEVLAVPALSIGKMIYDSKLYLETTDLFAWTTVVIVLSVTIESVFCAVVDRFGKRFERRVNTVAKA